MTGDKDLKRLIQQIGIFPDIFANAVIDPQVKSIRIVISRIIEKRILYIHSIRKGLIRICGASGDDKKHHSILPVESHLLMCNGKGKHFIFFNIMETAAIHPNFLQKINSILF